MFKKVSIIKSSSSLKSLKVIYVFLKFESFFSSVSQYVFCFFFAFIDSFPSVCWISLHKQSWDKISVINSCIKQYMIVVKTYLISFSRFDCFLGPVHFF